MSNNEMYDRITGAGNASQELPGCVAKHSSIAYENGGDAQLPRHARPFPLDGIMS